MGIAHLDEVRRHELAIGHLRATWTFLGDAAESVGVGLRRIELPPAAWSTPAHDHGRSEEIFYVLAGRGLAWHAGATAEIGPGDCIVYRPGHGAHTLHALEALDVLAFGPRDRDESPGFPRIGMSLVGRRAVDSAEGRADGMSIQFAREAAIGPPELPPEPGPRPQTIVNLAAVAPQRLERGRIARTRRDLGRGAGSVSTGLKHIEVDAGREAAPLHCHSLEEEIFVVLDGAGALLLDRDETPLRAGHVVARPPGSAVGHGFRAGADGLTMLAYGTRDPGDLCYYPRSKKIAFRGVGLIARLEQLDYWDGED